VKHGIQRCLTLSLIAAGSLVACDRSPTTPAAAGTHLFASQVAPGSAPTLKWSPTTSTSPDTWDFGTLGAGATSSRTFTLNNSGGRSAGTVGISLTGSSAFTITVDGCSGQAVNKKQDCTVTVQYAPTALGQSDQATLTATGEHTSADLALTGVVSSIDPASFSGTMDVGESVTIHKTIRTALPLDLVFGTDFFDNHAGGLSFSFTCTDAMGCNGVGAGEARTFDVTFTALAAGTYHFTVGADGVGARETDQIVVK
jgi:hypothetical protein